MQWTFEERIDLQHPTGARSWPDLMMVQGDSRAHGWRVSVYDGGAAVDLTAYEISASFDRADGKTIPVLGTAAGNVASTVLPQSVYAVSGALRGVLQAKQGAQVITLASGRWFVRRGAGYDVPQGDSGNGNAGGLNTAGAKANQVPTADGAGGWAWKDQQGGGGAVEVDATLTQTGKAADAKATGNAVGAVKKDVTALANKVTQLQISGGGGIDDDLNLFAVEGETNAEKLFNALQTGGSYSGHANKMVLEYAKCTAPGSGVLGAAQYYVVFRDGWAAAPEDVDVVIKNTIFEPEGENAVLLQYMYAAGGSITYEGCTFRNVLFWFGQGAKKKIILRNCIFEDNKYHAIQCGEWNSNCEYIIEGCTFRHMRPDKAEYRADVENQIATGSLKINGWGHGFMRVMGYDLTMTIRDCLFYDNMGSLNILFSKSSHVDTVDPARFHLYIERCTFQKTNGSAIAFNSQPVTGWIKDCKFYNIGENRCNEEGYDFPEDKKPQWGSGTEDDPYVYPCGVGGNGIFSYNWTPRHELVISGNWMYNIMENGIEGNYREVSNNHIENTGYRMDEGLWNPSTECIYGNNAIIRNNVIRNPTRGEPGIVIPSWSDGQNCVIEDNLIEFSKPGQVSESTGIEIMFQNEKFDYELLIRRNTIRGFSKKYHIYNTHGGIMPIHIEDDNDTDEPILNASDYDQRNLVGVDFVGKNATEMVRDPYFLSVNDSGLPTEWGAKAGNLAVYTNGNERFLRIYGTSMGACAYIYQDYRLGSDVYVARLKFRVRTSSGKIGIVPLSMQDSGSIVPNYANRFIFNPTQKQFEFETDGDNPNEWHDVTHSMIVTENARIAIISPEIDDTEGAEHTSTMDIKDVSVVMTRVEPRVFESTEFTVAGQPYNFDNLNISYLPANGFSINYYIPGKTFAYNGSWNDATWMMGKHTGGDLGRGKINILTAAKLYNNLVIWYKSDFDLNLNGLTMECGNLDTYCFISSYNGAKVNIINGTIKAKNFAYSVGSVCECTINDGVTIATDGEGYALLVAGGKSSTERTVLNVYGGTIGKTLSYAYTDINFDVADGVTATMERLQTSGKISISKNNKVTFKNGAGEIVEVTDIRKMTGMFTCVDITVEYAEGHTEEDLVVTGDESSVSYTYIDENGDVQEGESSLSAAWNIAGSTAETRKGAMTIKLLDDVYTYTGLYLWGGGEIILNLNGFNITNDYQYYTMYLRDGIDLTIMDTSERETTGVISSANYTSVICAGVTVTLNSGILKQESGNCISLDNSTLTLSGNGSMVGKNGISASEDSKILLESGSITATNHAIDGSATVTVHGGEYTATNNALVAGTAIFEAVEGKTATFSGTISLANNAQIAAKTLVTVNGERVMTLKNAKGTIEMAYSAELEEIPATEISLSHNTLSVPVEVTETIKATVTPEDTTDIVKWSASPSGIVRINNGQVTGLTTGDTTITATAGSQTATCAVTVTEAVSETLYELPDVTTFVSGEKKSIDTGVKLFENAATTAPDYTILMDMAAADDITFGSGVSPCIFHCADDSKGNGVSAYVESNGVGTPICSYRGFGEWLDTNAEGIKTRRRYAIRLTGSSLHIVTTDGTHDWRSASATLPNIANTLILGAGRNASGALERYFDGTLYAFKVLRGGMTDEDLTAWLADIPQIPATNVALSASTLSLEVDGTAKLTATVTPTDSTDTVVWSVSPADIVSVSRGNVTALAVGNATITATAGSVSATCAVTVTAKTVVPDTPTLLYELPQETTFTNDTDGIIDTGIKLFEDVSSNPKYTILFDVTTAADIENVSNKYCLLHCLNEISPYPGFVVQTAQSGGNAPKLRCAVFGSDSSIVWKPNGKRMRIAVRIDGSTFSFAPKDGDTSMADISVASAYCNVTQTLLIGGYQDAEGTHGRFWEGTLHSLKLYSGLMTKEECQAWVNQTEE